MLAQEEATMIKKKRSKRPRLSSPLLLTIATTSSTTTTGGSGVISDDVSPSHSFELTHSGVDEEEEDMANCLILLAKGRVQMTSAPPPPDPAAEAYQCKTCSKSFVSFQALGGHRASHKKPIKPTNVEEQKKGLMREKEVSFDDGTSLSLQIRSASSGSPGNPGSKIRIHECSICGAEYGSGQALGGHMRRHRPIPAAVGGDGEAEGGKRARNLLSLDLNLPAPEDDRQESKFPFVSKEQVIVFAASPLIDCHY